MDILTTAAVAAALLAAAFVHSAIGFGIGLVSMPMLATLLGVRTAAPVVALVGLTLNGTLVAGSWRSVDFRAGVRLVAGAAFGFPLGAIILRFAPEDLVRSILGVLLIALGLSHFASTRVPTLRHGGWVYGFGFASGVLGGAYTLIGPPVVAFAAMRRWPADRFRATLQSYFVPAGVLMCATHLASGLWTTRVVGLYAVGLPAVIVGLGLGRVAAARIPPGRFDGVLYAALIVFGLMLMW